MMFVKIVEGDAYCPVTKIKTDTVDEILCTFPQLENASVTEVYIFLIIQQIEQFFTSIIKYHPF